MRQPVPFGKYLLLDRISVGGMAEVFKAKSYGVEGFEKIIAIKRILPTMGEDRDFIKMFIDEAKIAGQLAHANICQIFELGRIDGSHFIAMEYIWGKDLLQIQNRLRKLKQPMPIALAAFVIAKVLEGLDYAHRKRDPLGRPLEIVHRDCSPQNVLVSYEGEVKVIDFGIAKATSRNSRTMAGVLKGKFGYMSPEQVRGLPLDRRSDLFALGTMLFECLTGERLFQGETDFSTLEKVRNVDIPLPRSVNPAIPEVVEKIILKALAKDVDDRYQWCSEMLADLQAYLMGQEVVFTAKSLAGWLKDVFAPEIERERQLLEQYKRVGRDGLIAGLPSAEAKVDVVESLGEAGQAEGDPTTLGGPNFDDLEQAIASAAAPEVGPAPGSPAARGATARPPSSNDEADQDFGEEAPTEIFGEIDHGAKPGTPAAVPQPRAPTASQPVRAPTATPAAAQPVSRPPAPPHARPPTVRPPDQQQPMAASPGSGASPRPQSQPAPQPQMVSQSYAQQPQQYPVYGGASPSPAAMGTPGGIPTASPMGPIGSMGPLSSLPGMAPHHDAQMNGLAQQGSGPSRTLLGSAPPGLPNYGQQQPPQHMQQPLTPPPGYPQPPPGYPQQPQNDYQSQPQPAYGSQPQYAQQYPQHGPHGPQQQYMPPSPYPLAQPQQQGQYGGLSGQFNSVPVVPIEQGAVDGAAPRKKSSIGRDVAIGVAIAALVLGAFLIVKFVILDKGTEDATASGPATIRLQIPAGVAADLFVDDKKLATVTDKQEIPVAAGERKVRLVGPNGAHCDQTMKLAAHQTTTLVCKIEGAAPAAGSDGSAAVPAVAPSAGSGSAAPAADSGSGSAAPPVAAGSGSAGSAAPAVATTDKMPAEVKPGDKTAPAVAPPADKTPPAPPPGDKTVAHPVPGGSVQPDHGTPPKPPKQDEDLLGSLNGGEKPGDKKTATPPAHPAPAHPVAPPTPPAHPAAPPTPPAPKVDTAASTGKGYLQAYSKPSARIAVDNVDTGLSTPIAGRALPLAPGKHKITFSLGGDKYTYTVTIKAGATETLSKDLQ